MPIDREAAVAMIADPATTAEVRELVASALERIVVHVQTYDWHLEEAIWEAVDWVKYSDPSPS